MTVNLNFQEVLRKKKSISSTLPYFSTAIIQQAGKAYFYWNLLKDQKNKNLVGVFLVLHFFIRSHKHGANLTLKHRPRFICCRNGKRQNEF